MYNYLSFSFYVCFENQFNVACDFSFGIVLFELGTGLRAYDSSRPQGYAYLREYVENSDKMALRDSKAGGDYLNIYIPIMSLGSTCSKSSAKERPEMVQVMPVFRFSGAVWKGFIIRILDDLLAFSLRGSLSFYIN